MAGNLGFMFLYVFVDLQLFFNRIFNILIGFGVIFVCLFYPLCVYASGGFLVCFVLLFTPFVYLAGGLIPRFTFFLCVGFVVLSIHL